MLPFEEQKQGYFPCGQPRQCSGISEILVVVGGICMNRRLKEVDYYSKEKGWQSLADISTHHSNMHSYSVIAHNNDIYITGGHSNTQCTVDHVSVYQERFLKNSNFKFNSNAGGWSLLRPFSSNMPYSDLFLFFGSVKIQCIYYFLIFFLER